MTQTTKDPSANSGQWTDGANAYTSNNQYAYTSTNNDVQRYQGYGFSLSGEIIDKVEIGVEFYCASNENIRVRVSWDGGTTWSDWSQKFTLTSEDIIWVDFTSVTTWTPTKLNDSNFRVEIKFNKGAGSGCFAPDTLITMADGSQKPITEIKLGDKVLTHKGVGTVTAKTVHRSVNNYRLVQFKNVQMFPTHAVREGDEWHGLPKGLKLVFRKHIVNIETDKKSFYANGVLVHNITKGAWTAYLDWIPTRVTHQAGVTAKNFSDTGGGSDSFLNPYRAMGFSEVGGGAETFGIPFKALGFSDVGSGADVFSILFKSLKFDDVASGLDVFVNPFRGMGFADVGLGTDVFTLLRELAFLDSALGTDVFAQQVVGIILKQFSDISAAIDIFGKGIGRKVALPLIVKGSSKTGKAKGYVD